MAGDAAALECWITAWSTEADLERRRALEWRVAELLRDALVGAVRAELRGARRAGGEGSWAAEDVVGQTLTELPRILATYVENTARIDAGGFRAYLVKAALNITRGLVERSVRERERLERLPDARPSALGRAPTTPSGALMRSELFERIDRRLAEFEAVDQTILRRVILGASYAEVGRELGMPRRTVQDRCERCMERLKFAIQQAFGGDPREG